MTNTPAARKGPRKGGRRPALTEQGRSLLQKQRARLNREQAVLGERLVHDAQVVSQMGAANERHFHPEFNAMARGVVRRVASVLASENVTPGIQVYEGSFKAYTDFETITVSFLPSQDPRLTAAVLRGLLYHEGGHIRWTTPVTDIAKSLGMTPLSITPSIHKAWNALEDQRMETAVMSDSPRKAGYFVPVVLTEMAHTPEMAAANWPLFIWRRYLPKHIRRAARRAFVELHGARGERLAQSFERVVTEYVLATDFTTMWNAVIEMERLLAQHQTAFPLDKAGHDQMRRYRAKSASQPKEIPVDPSMQDEDLEEGDEAVDAGEAQTESTQGTPVPTATASKDDDQAQAQAPAVDMPGSGADQAADEGNEAGQDDDKSDEDGGTGAGGGEGDHTPKSFQDMLDEAIKDAEEERDSDPALDGDVRAYEQALDTASKLAPYVGGVSNDVAAAGRAEAAAQAIEDAFMVSVMDRMPAWVEQQRRGVLNVGRYATRQAGDVDVFRQWADDDQPGYNLAVSLLLDYSGSMGGSMKDLAEAAYAAKLACQRLNIPCTVTLWDESARTLWDAEEQAQGLPILRDAGGTQPDAALADLDNQRNDREQHLVLIMTDGMWQGDWEKPGKRSLASMADSGRTFVGFGYGVSAQGLLNKGCRYAYSVKDLMDIPKALERMLPEMA